MQRTGLILRASNSMSVHSASGRKTVRIPKGPAKVIPLPAGGRRRCYRRNVGIGIASMGLAAAGAALVWFYLVPLIGLAPDLTAGMNAQEAEILRLVNDERKRAGAPSLKSSRRLMLASRGHSYDMALRNYLGHDGPAGDTPAERVRGVGVDASALGENIYRDRDSDRTKLADRAVKGWLNSPEHRANMLSPDFGETGIGIARAADGTAYVTQDFAK
jgi:Cysteine-rich secretory protein family